MTQWQVEFFESLQGNPVVFRWFDEQSPKVKAKFGRIFDLLQENGTLVGMPYVRDMGEKLYEIRVEQNTNTYRIIYFFHTGRRIILLHGFQKKAQKTPKKEIELAKQRKKEFLLSEADKAPATGRKQK